MSPDDVRPILQRDPAWSAYAMGDLDPRWFSRCEWRTKDDALVLLVRAFDPPVLFAMGDAPTCVSLLEGEPRFSIQVRPEMAAALSECYTLTMKPMVRMALQLDRFPGAEGLTERLTSQHLAEIRALYEDGAPRGEMPDFFFDAMVEEGVFCGVRDREGLAAVAGTHLMSEAERVAAVGNVYTRLNARGRGHARRVTAAVVSGLRNLGIETIALNVAAGNKPAMAVYKGLGFTCACEFFEGRAQLV